MTRIVKVTEIYIILALCGLGLCSDANGAIPDLIAHWEFDEGTGNIAYDSAGDNDGTLVGDPCWTSGQIDGALLFDGDGDYVSLLEDAVTTTEFTVAAWANHFGPGGGEHNRNIIFCQRDDEMGDNHCAIHLASEGEYNDAFSTIRSSNGSYQILTYPKKDYNEWHHYAMTVDSNDFILYIDGIEVERTSNNQAGDYITSIDYVNIGRQRYTGVNNGFFNGVIDDVRVYDAALSAEEIERLYRGLLIGLEIEGPNEVTEDSQIQYKAIEHYDNNSTKDVTDLADWSVEPNDIASITAGLLTTEIIDLPTDVTITAQYSEGDVNETAEKQVSILAICPSGSALDFDGEDDYVETTSLDNIHEPITISVWVKTDGSGNTQTIFGRNKYIDCYFYHNFLRLGADNKVYFGDRPGCDENHYVISTYPIEIKQWCHLAVTRASSSDIKLYINGVLNKSDYTIPCQNPGINYRIGTINTGHYSFNGKIDDLRIFDKALTAQEVQALMHRKLSGDEPNLVAYWDFDEGQGQVSRDLSGNDNHSYLGSDPCGIDNSDPNWVDSDAPVGICTLEGFVERNLVNVLDNKLDILEQLGITMAKEEALLEMLNTSFKDRDFGTADKGDVVTAKQKIHSAIQHEEQSQETLEESIEKLGDALDALDIELYDDD